ncbi:hypothetical protein NEOLEDRAFT_1152720 [Neolentinus lepideus HHB14362 ss-1]|uniref:Uncharacterized protein n=1 Tax=Neolentinus lepideus HHB14362 ss-1 TaxID=1314782 RepID=A0A165MET9_9AGAM|nr:hypothetical protein NEOLEDRAFT_1152720 [Neolentinus lepideus HHB14362 ss-1]
MHINSSGQSDVSSLRPPRRALTATSVQLRDDFDAYTTTDAPPDAASEVYDGARERFVSYHRAEMGNLLLDPSDASDHHRRSRGIGDAGSMECVGRRYTTTTGAASRRAEAGRRGFQLVERKILEDGPERTVSVWREEVAKSVDGDVEDEEGPLTEMDAPVSEMGEMGRRRGKGLFEYMHTGSTSARRLSGGHERVRSPSGTGSERGWERVKVHSISTVSAFINVHVMLQSPHVMSASYHSLPSHAISASYPSLPSPPLSNRSHSHGSPRPRRTPSNSQSTININHHHTRTPSQSTTTRHPTSPPPTTLASLLSAPTPPLTHLLPTLARLGITHPAHLAALARMGEEVRDREVRSVALGEGRATLITAIGIRVSRSGIQSEAATAIGWQPIRTCCNRDRVAANQKD